MAAPRFSSRPQGGARSVGRNRGLVPVAELGISIDALAWQDMASCRDTDPEAFFPEVEQVYRHPQVRRMCLACPVRRACIDYATRHQLVGIWGATSTNQRRWIRKRRGEVAA